MHGTTHIGGRIDPPTEAMTPATQSTAKWNPEKSNSLLPVHLPYTEPRLALIWEKIIKKWRIQL